MPINLYHAFKKSKAIAMERMKNPRVVPLAWYHEAWKSRNAILGPDPWEYGLTDRNRKTLEMLAGYSHEQGLTPRRMTARRAVPAGVPGPQARRRAPDLRARAASVDRHDALNVRAAFSR